jgi:broad specificity phosphatase PhoE
MPGGESFLEIQGRFIPFIEELVKNGKNSNHNIILVEHGGLYLAMLPAIFKNIDFAFALEHKFPYTACAIAETLSNGLYCTSWCGVSLNF